jgi:hypothetical protein
MDCQSNAKPSEKDHDLPGIRTQDIWSSSQHTSPLHHLGRLDLNPYENRFKLKTIRNIYENQTTNHLIQELDENKQHFVNFLIVK